MQHSIGIIILFISKWHLPNCEFRKCRIKHIERERQGEKIQLDSENFCLLLSFQVLTNKKKPSKRNMNILKMFGFINLCNKCGIDRCQCTYSISNIHLMRKTANQFNGGRDDGKIVFSIRYLPFKFSSYFGCNIHSIGSALKTENGKLKINCTYDMYDVVSH